jgi:cytochrome P450
MEVDWLIFLGGMNDTWRKGRKILYGSLRSGAMGSYWQVMQENTNEFLAQLRANPKDFRAHIKLSVGHVPYII